MDKTNNKLTYGKRVLKRTILLCWILLFICFIIKLIGGNWFEVLCNNLKFISACSYVDTHIISQYFIGCVSTFITLSLYLLAILQRFRFNKKQTKLLIFVILIGTAVKIYNPLYGLIVDLIQLLILPLLFRGKIKRTIIALSLNIIFQVISLITKNISIINFTTENILIAIIYSIDVYIMLLLYYLYSNYKKE